MMDSAEYISAVFRIRVRLNSYIYCCKSVSSMFSVGREEFSFTSNWLQIHRCNMKKTFDKPVTLLYNI